ncbi:MAG: DinB family protein [Dehalococcoidia bacterium]|nr:DinB family protein [Dehalococcoidia bacterium]
MAGKSGLSSVPGGAHGSPGWEQWIKSVQVDLPQLREYAKAVHAASDAFVAGLKPEDLDRPVDLAGFGLGVQTLNWAFYNFIIGHAAQHTGEISTVKGCQKLKGYPF